MKKYFLFSTLLAVSMPIFASSELGVTISNLNINRELGQAFIRTSQTPVANGCHTDTNWNYTFLVSTYADKAAYSTLLAAKMAGKSIDIVGFGSCPSSGYTAIEELRWVTIPN